MGTVASVEESRRLAKERFEALPWPKQTDEEWRRTDPKTIPVDKVDLRPADGALKCGFDPLPPEAAAAGVVLTDLRSALEKHAELVEAHLFQTGEPEGLAKFVALHQAEWSQGLFCHVPDGVKLELPLRAWASPVRGGVAIYPHTLVVLGRGAELTLVDERRSEQAAGPVLFNEMTEMVVGEGAFLRYVRLQRLGKTVTELFTQRAVLERGANFLNIHVTLGGALTKSNVETVLRGTDARADLLGILFGAGDQHFDVHTLQDHRAERTFSDLLYKTALKDTAKSVYTGLIRITKQGQKSDAYQANRNLLLSRGAVADSVPMLEILADDVRCTHGVAVGPVDPDQEFYLTSRGLSPAEAQRLIVQGFFEQVLRRIPLASMREEVEGDVVHRLETPHG